MAITQVGSTVSGTANNGGDVTLTLPTMAEGDVVVVIGGYAQKPSTDPATPTGYTLVTVGSTVTNAANGYGRIGAWYKVQGPTPDANVTGAGFGSTSASTTYHAIVLRGVDTAAVVDVTSAVVANADPGAPDAPAVTVATIGAWVFAVGYANTTDDVVTGISGYTGLAWAAADDTHDCSLGFSYKEATATGTEDPAAYTDISGLNPGAFTFAIKPAAGGGGPVDLTAADSVHAHAVESPTLTQVHVTTPADSAHGHTVDAATLTQVHALTPTESSHGHAADSPTLAQTHALAPADSAHGHATDSPALTQTHALAPADSSHEHTAESPVLSQSGDLAPVDSLHAHAVESPTLTQTHSLEPAESTHGHAATSPTLTTGTTLQPADSAHAHTSEQPTLTQAHQLAPDDSTHEHTTEAPALTQVHEFTPADSVHSHVADSPLVVIPSGLPPPAANTVVTPAEVRILTVAAENRIVTTPAENRIITD